MFYRRVIQTCSKTSITFKPYSNAHDCGKIDKAETHASADTNREDERCHVVRIGRDNYARGGQKRARNSNCSTPKTIHKRA